MGIPHHISDAADNAFRRVLLAVRDGDMSALRRLAATITGGGGDGDAWARAVATQLRAKAAR